MNSYECGCDTIHDKQSHILEYHIKDILKEPDLHENQPWKQQEILETLCWITREASSTVLQDSIHLLLPPLLIVLDDYDPDYKKQGVVMVHDMILKLDASFVSSYGIDNLFLESLFKCLTYLSQERDIELLQATYPCILDLIAKVKKNRIQLYERVLTEGVLTGFSYAGQKIKFLPILIVPIGTLYQALGILGVQYLKALVPVLTDALCMVSSHPKLKQIHVLAAHALRVVIKTCWPRIPYYKGRIMASIAKSWTFYYEQKDQAMCDDIKQVYQVFEAACQGQHKLDQEALLSFNPTLFQPLFF
ncbi:hypothetical protein CU098_012694 [Rhizopus stolonifer]|uniref:Uncharacterized protein n=1 Tax=Rhizopus stolonifer TaxID=4846 RepID=A0A367KRJ5_RHIST|nr:hypothetical protein CU098_012694 [Rhizopus stolonifer]